MVDQERLDSIREYTSRASGDYWVYDEGDHSWDLYSFLDSPDPQHGMKILKAPKQSREYATYWPRKEDAIFIVKARSDVPWLLDVIENLQNQLAQKEENNGIG